MIKADKVTRYYGSFAAVRDASFDVAERECVGLLGLNGAGKSTMLRILVGLLQPSSGTVWLGNVDLATAEDALRRRIGFLPEDPPLYRDMRVVDYLRWVGEIKGRSRGEVDKALPDVLETCQIEHVGRRIIGELSHGYQKRVGIAQAIVHRPDVVVLDEPVSGLDPQQIVEMRTVVRRLQASATVLLSSHMLSEVAQTCDRVLVIHRGEIVAEGSEQALGRALSPNGRTTLVLVGDGERIEACLRQHDGIEDWGMLRGDEDNRDVFTVDVVLSESPERLVARLVEAGIGVRAVKDTVSELERVFLRLTEEAPLGHGTRDGERSVQR